MTDTYITIKKREQEGSIWLWIKHRLNINNSSFSKLAVLSGVKKTNFLRVKHLPSPKYEAIIAKNLGLNAWDLWSDRYDAAHNPNRISSRYQGHKSFIEHTFK